MAPSTLVPSELPIQHTPHSRPNLERQVSVHQATLTELANLRSTIEQHTVVIQQLQCDVSVLIADKMQSNQATMHIAGPIQAPGGNIPPAANDEINTLREENRKMKERLATIASAMGIAAAGSPIDSFSNRLDMGIARAPESSLGKRKRNEDDQLPTPHSIQSSHGGREFCYGGPFFPPPQPGAGFSLESQVIIDDDRRWNDYAIQSAISNPPAIAANQGHPNAFQGGTGYGAIEFSDDEMAGLHFPSLEPAPPAQETIQQYRTRIKALHGPSLDPSEAGSMDLEPHGPIDMDQAEHWTMADVERMIEEEKMPPPAKEPREPKERIQSTEKYLNAELEELGLTEWIGKDKKDPTYRSAISAARTAHKEAKKMEALARKGLRSAPLPEPDSRCMSEGTSDGDSSDGHFDTELKFDFPVPVPIILPAPSIDSIDELAASEPEPPIMTAATSSRPVGAPVLAVDKANPTAAAKTPSARSGKPGLPAEFPAEDAVKQDSKKSRTTQRERRSGLMARANPPLRDLGRIAESSTAKDPTEPLAEGAVQQSKENPRAGQRGRPSKSGKRPKTLLENTEATVETSAPRDPTESLVESLGQKNHKKPRKGRKSELAERASTPLKGAEETTGAAAQKDQTELSAGDVDPKSSKKPRARKSELTKRAVEPVERSEKHTGATAYRELAEPLAKITGQHQNKVLGSGPHQQENSSSNEADPPRPKILDEVDTAQQDQAEDRIMTRRQQRKAQIQKMDLMAQEAMETEA